MSFYQGIDALFKYGAAGADVGAMATLANVQDVQVRGDKETVERAVRGNRWKGKKATFKTLSFEITVLYDQADAGFQALKNAWMNDTTVGLAALDSDSHGLVADFIVSNMERAEPLDGDMQASFTVELNTDTRTPSWV